MAALFDAIDSSQSGEVSLRECQALCASLPSPPSPSVVEALFSQADGHGRRFLNPSEFSAFCEGVKLLSGCTANEMVACYAEAELKRQFVEHSAQASVMSPGALQQAVRVVAVALGSPVEPELLAQATRRVGGRITPDAFCTILCRLFPGEDTLTLAVALRLAEQQQQQRRSTSTTTASVGHQEVSSSIVRTSSIGSPDCAECESRQSKIRQLREEVEGLTTAHNTLLERLTLAEEAVSTSDAHLVRRADAAESLLAERQQSLDTLGSLYAAAQDRLTTVEEERDAAVAKCEAMTSQLERCTGASDATLRELKCRADVGQATITQLEAELADARSEAVREVAEAQGAIDALAAERRVANEHLAPTMEADAAALRQLLTEYQARMATAEETAVAASARTAAFEHHFAMQIAGVERREQEAIQREEGAARQLQLRLAEVESETLRLRARESELQVVASSLATREQALREEELRVSEASVAAEAVSLPERRRRMELLKGIELQLVERERKLASSEESYLASLANTELRRLREENVELQSQLRRVIQADVERNADGTHSTDATTKTPVRQPPAADLAECFQSPSYQLL